MNKKNILIIILVVGLAISGGVNVTQYMQTHPIALFTQPKPFSTPIFGGWTLINGNITVTANDIYYIEFNVPQSDQSVTVYNIKVSGTFTVLGRDTIRVYVTTPTMFNPLSSDFSPNYDSGLATSGDINLTLFTGGTYYLVYNNENYLYNNTQSQDKIVDTNVIVSYMED